MRALLVLNHISELSRQAAARSPSRSTRVRPLLSTGSAGWEWGTSERLRGAPPGACTTSEGRRSDTARWSGRARSSEGAEVRVASRVDNTRHLHRDLKIHSNVIQNMRLCDLAHALRTVADHQGCDGFQSAGKKKRLCTLPQCRLVRGGLSCRTRSKLRQHYVNNH